MASRMFWIIMVAVALVAGTLFQGRSLFFGWADDSSVERRVERAVEAPVQAAVESEIAKLHVVNADGRPVKLTEQTKRELGEAMRRFAAAEARLAMVRVADSNQAAAAEARSRRDAAKAELERLQAEIERQEAQYATDRDLARQQVQQEIRSSVRETVRAATRG